MNPWQKEPCCDSHVLGLPCCDPDDCGPCCPNCPTCPTLSFARGIDIGVIAVEELVKQVKEQPIYANSQVSRLALDRVLEKIAKLRDQRSTNLAKRA